MTCHRLGMSGEEYNLLKSELGNCTTDELVKSGRFKTFVNRLAAADLPRQRLKPHVHLDVMNEQGTFFIQWDEPSHPTQYDAYMLRLFVFEVIQKHDVKLREIREHYPMLEWNRRSTSTYNRWLGITRDFVDESHPVKRGQLERTANFFLRDYTSGEK